MTEQQNYANSTKLKYHVLSKLRVSQATNISITLYTTEINCLTEYVEVNYKKHTELAR